ncbi:UDP-N-acetylglucosamine 1-carboxyvinyltransferase [Desulfitispora alkaliphila]|uniref:UDP-N-acetylglucosamine 1-carboxyvinyltransferase n=1 Tax=Desulfitispora alkaliphila TaxID=622674 RepID=UPI003D1BE74C
MSKFIIKGGNRLEGEVCISGAKNAILPIFVASLMSESDCIIHNIAMLRDVEVMEQLLTSLGAKIKSEGNGTYTINSNNISHTSISEQLMRKMRASNLIIGPMLGRFGEVKIAYPGGCNIGDRPMDIHLKSFEKMGAEIYEEHGFITARAKELRGADIHFDFPSVGATENVMMAAALAEGKTIIRNAAREPEVVDLQSFLNGMGAKVQGAGTDTIRIEGQKKLGGIEHTVIPDRIETGTYMIGAAITRGDIVLDNVIVEHVEPLTAKLREAGVKIETESGKIHVKTKEQLKPIDIKTLPYPGFPTDMQPQLMALLSTIQGTSIIIETIFENRFKHVDELRRMGAKIKIDGRVAIIKGVENLSGTNTQATDLRAGAALVLAGLVASGDTVVENINYIQRGYENLPEKLRGLGAQIKTI